MEGLLSNPKKWWKAVRKLRFIGRNGKQMLLARSSMRLERLKRVRKQWMCGRGILKML